MKIWIPETKCDFDNQKWCKTLQMIFDQQYATMRSFQGELRVSYDFVSQNNAGSVILYPERLKTEKEKEVEFCENINGEHLVVRGKYVQLALPNFCEFCGGKLYSEKFDEVKSI